MGLDTIAIVLDIENAFGIAIPDREAEKMLTVRDFHNLAWKYVGNRKDINCKSQNVFYKLRATLSDITNIPKQEIGTSICLSDVIPMENRRELWVTFSDGQC